LAGLFAARVAHDVRNPLASIKLQTQLVRARLQGTGDAQTLASLDAVSRDVLQVEAVVRDLLELARPGDLRLQPASLNSVVEEILQQLAPHLSYRDIAVHTDLSSAMPATVLDVDRFKQALLNIINNASDAMATGGTLSIATGTAPGQIRLDVCDDGPGVDPQVLPRVFDPFVSTKRDGVGLGLVNAKAVVEGHGGQITLAPLHPHGTRVTIQLPIRASDHG
jgi:signal transduction histidine kinase